MPSPFRTTRRVEFADTDMAGIVHFANFFRYMEAAEHAFLRACGLSVSLEWEGEHASFPRVSATCDYFRPARFQDVLEISVAVARLGSSSVAYGFEVFKGAEVIARGQITAVFCVFREGRMEARAIPPGIRERLERGPGLVGGFSQTAIPSGWKA
jgi:YbgC/YbaW family acyl-CoA thioester hydrolase